MANLSVSMEGVPTTGIWIWKDDPVNPGLDFVSVSHNVERQDKRRRTRGLDGSKVRDERISSGVQRAAMVDGSRTGATQKSNKLSVNMKEQTTDHLTVSLEDIKTVSLERMAEVHSFSPHFHNLLRKEKFDHFLVYLLNYFHCFYYKMELEIVKNPMLIEPSMAEKLEYAHACEKLTIAKKLLGGAYSFLLLGLELQQQHHMACGRSRVSKTYTDRGLFETFYLFCTFIVWITFRRKEFDTVKKEIGRLLRSDVFNPAIRVKTTDSDTSHSFEPLGLRKEIMKHAKSKDQKEISVSSGEIRYPHVHEKRPAIKSIVNQKSPAIVSILPSSKDEAGWLFARPTLNNKTSKNTLMMDIDSDGHYSDKLLDMVNFRAGILGEPYKQFNPQTLSPLGAEQEEGQGVNKEETTGLDDRTEETQESEKGISRQQTAVSRATTEAFTDDE